MQYSETTQKTIYFIETHLLEKIQLDDLTRNVGYSKFHLLRVFKQETGRTIGEYIRFRRLALAVSLLIESDESILSIAFLLHFQSQEAFTRAFKEIYSLPPGKYRKLFSLIHLKEENNKMTKETIIHGWILSGNAPEHYQMTLDQQTFHTGHQSALLKNISDVNSQQFATIMQQFKAEKYKGKRMKLTCYIKTEDVEKCGAWMRVDDNNGDMLQFDNMDNRPIAGTNGWNQYTIVLDVPEESMSIHFGVLLIGKGKVWMDGFQLVEVSEHVPTTNLSFQESLPKEPQNLDFSE
ncbi:helix-turn-helix transcriptional regulator [Cytobacillus sp. Sa5YUA1]|uniref:Helix-turn-helix transcriptional regulator n=1 Tax=Cytobacillus stercorigallinarum TaxID=2762240 RepID=A0ABR8QRZ2_9BACI|nr:AraC family transcriptional regulator [Cytobacillus stercorigallinarum]MBD7938289.1 helix-turn-helix transcriptional regulator [Cytobacillus stercorigallinarum]